MARDEHGRRKRGKSRSRGSRKESKSAHRLVTGPRFAEECIKAGHALEMFADERVLSREPKLTKLAKQHDIRVRLCDAQKLDALSEGVRHQGIVLHAKPIEFVSLHDLGELVIALDEITDPHNFGAIVRSAVAFGADLIVQERRAASITAVVSRASAGTIEHAKICQVVNLQKALVTLSDSRYFAVGLAGKGSTEDHAQVLPLVDAVQAQKGPLILVVGAEGKGLRRLVQKRCDCLAYIPHGGKAESLNASVAAGVALYETTRSRFLQRPPSD